MSARALMAGYGVWISALVVANFAFPPYQTGTYCAVGVSGACAVIFGARRNKPRRRRPWFLLGAALLAFSAGDLTYWILDEVMGQVDPFPSAADAFYLLGFFPLLLAGLLPLLRSKAGNRDRASILDALTLTAGLGLLSWIFLINPLVQSPDLTTINKIIAVSYPLYDILVLTVLVRMSTAFDKVRPAAVLLMGSIGALLIADVLYGWLQLAGLWEGGGPVDLLFFAFYAAAGAAALHPSMTSLTEPQVIRRQDMSRTRLVMLGLATLIAPAVLFAESLMGAAQHGLIISVLSAALFLLVVTRLSGVVSAHRQTVARERALRQAGAALLTAADLTEVTSVVTASVAALLPHGTFHRVVLTVAGSLGPDAEATPPAPNQPAMAMVATRTLPDVSDQLGDFEYTLCCPLDGRLVGGVLYVAANEITLTALQEAAQVLASQAALAIQSIAASDDRTRRESDAYFRSLVLNADDVILIVDDDDRIRYASPSVEPVLGVSEPTGTTLLDLVAPRDRAAAAAALEGARADADDHREAIDWSMIHSNGTPRDVEVFCRDLRHERAVHGMVVTLRDVTERRQLQRELLHHASHDSLTDLPNRELLTETLTRWCEDAKADDLEISLLVLDLDRFKNINDRYGHHVGDELLCAVATKLGGLVRSEDLVCRIGGDEFVVAMASPSHSTLAESMAERMVEAFSDPLKLSVADIIITASIGIAQADGTTEALDLINDADIAMYQAKAAGRNTYALFDISVREKAQARMSLEQALRGALGRGELSVAFQPIVGLTDDDLVGFEALMRWEHPDHGTISPAEFIPIAEETGLIVPWGAWLLGEAAETLAAWDRERGPDLPKLHMSVNISTRQLRNSGIVDVVRRVLDKTKLPPSSLWLEITESVLADDPDVALAVLNALHDLGVKLSIDDFGTGYASLNYVKKLPVEILKIDKSFIDGIGTDDHDEAIIISVLAMARALGHQVVAEGVERMAQRDWLADNGCHMVQGWLYGKPRAAATQLAWIEHKLRPLNTD